MMDPEGDIGIFSGIGSGLLQVDLVEGELLGTFAGDVFVVDGLVTQQPEGEVIHVMALGRIQHVGFEHGVMLDTFHLDTVIGKHMGIIFQVLADLADLAVLQQRLKRTQHLVFTQLLRSADIVMSERYIGGLSFFDREGHADHAGIHVIQAGGLGIEGKAACLLELFQPADECFFIEYRFILPVDSSR